MMFLPVAVLATATIVSANIICCKKLEESSIGSKLITRDQPRYVDAIMGFWSGQSRDDKPNCIIQPSSATDVSVAVKILAHNKCEFSIKGGGHTPWAGAASANGGITIDMANIASTTVSAGKSVASIGAGSRWGQVYTALIPQGLMIAGGRDSTVGVGGLIIGGGYSWFAPIRGFVCDSLVNVEIVLGDRCIVNANRQQNSDLFKVLKGGGNNFGIVTRYDTTAFPQGNLWGGLMIYPDTTGPAQIDAFVKFNDHIKDNPAGNYIAIWSYQQATGASVIINCLEYTKPVVNASAYNDFLVIPDLSFSTMRIDNLKSFTDELAAASTANGRYIFVTATFQSNAELYAKAVQISNSYREPYKGVVGLTWALLFQPIPQVVSDASIAAGGNILGVDRNPGNLMLFLIYITWTKPEDDKTFKKAANDVVRDIKKVGAQMGLNVPYIYLNYADNTQDVLGGYGDFNRDLMAAASKKYDPEGVFQKLVPGGRKIKGHEGTGIH